MRRLIVLWVLVAAAPARADDPDPPPTRVTATLEGPIARIAVRYRLRFAGPRIQQELVSLAMPGRAAVTRATATLHGVPHRLELIGADQATAAFDAIHERAPGPNRRSAVIIETRESAVAVGIASRAGTVTLDLELELPTCFSRDVRYAAVPEGWLPLLPPALRTLPRTPDELELACAGHGFSGQIWIGLALPHAAKPHDRIASFAGRLALGETHIARLELDVASTLAEVPSDLATVILVDASRSLSVIELAIQRALVESYARAAPNGRIQVVAYARHARALLPDWATASSARVRIDDELRTLARANGSNVDAGLVEAGRWLSKVRGTRRIVVLTDERLANRLTAAPPASLQGLVPAGTLIHVVALEEGGGAPERSDDAALAALAAATEGMAIRTGLPPAGLDATLLVRPLTIDRIQLKTPGWTAMAHTITTCGDTLEPGQACTWWGRGDALAGPIVVEALVWGQKLVRVIQPDAQQATSVARDLAGLELVEVALHEQVQRAARAVNAVWSLYAEWGGNAGYTEMLGMIHSVSCGGCGGSSNHTGPTIGIGRMIPGPTRPPLDLRTQLAGPVAACGLAGARVEVEIENTLDEIVNVRVLTPGARTSVHACVEQAIWDTAISVPPAYPHETTRVVFGG